MADAPFADFLNAQVLRRAAARVERGWCQGWDAVDASGVGVRYDAPTATSWCALGAVLAEAGCVNPAVAGYIAIALHRICMEGYGENIAVYNDAPGRTAAEVAARLRAVADHLDPPQLFTPARTSRLEPA